MRRNRYSNCEMNFSLFSAISKRYWLVNRQKGWKKVLKGKFLPEVSPLLFWVIPNGTFLFHSVARRERRINLSHIPRLWSHTISSFAHFNRIIAFVYSVSRVLNGIWVIFKDFHGKIKTSIKELRYLLYTLIAHSPKRRERMSAFIRPVT